MSLSLGSRLKIRSMIHVAAEPLPLFWPMRTFIHPVIGGHGNNQDIAESPGCLKVADVTDVEQVEDAMAVDHALPLFLSLRNQTRDVFQVVDFYGLVVGFSHGPLFEKDEGIITGGASLFEEPLPFMSCIERAAGQLPIQQIHFFTFVAI